MRTLKTHSVKSILCSGILVLRVTIMAPVPFGIVKTQRFTVACSTLVNASPQVSTSSLRAGTCSKWPRFFVRVVSSVLFSPVTEAKVLAVPHSKWAISFSPLPG